MSEWEPISENNLKDKSERVFVQGRLKTFFIFCLSLLLTLVFLWCVLNPEFIMSETSGSSTTRRGRQGDALRELMGDNFIYLFWGITLLFGWMTLFYFISLFKPSRIWLNSRGMTEESWLSSKFYPWEQISPFRLTTLSSSGVKKKLINFTSNIGGGEGKGKTRKLRASAYGLKAEDFLQQLNDYRERSILANDTDTEVAVSYPTPNPIEDEKARTAETSLQNESSDWKAPHERGEFMVREERAPWGRWLAGAAALGLVAAGALWLASKVVVPRDLPMQEQAQAEPEKEAPKIGADDAAWTRALEKDTLEGYREYLEAFPDGKHKEKAQAEIDAYDNKAWATAEQRNTLAGYEDYLEAWPEGLHASKAKERIAEIKAAAEARAKDAAERAALDKTHWEAAARENTIESYNRYLGQHPTGKYVDEAQQRIAQIKADQASAAAIAAEDSAWNAASASNTVGAYQQYLTSYPQGRYAAQAIAALDNLRPAVGKTFKDCSECPEMVSLPTGTASLGAGDNEAGAKPNEKPQRPVTFANMFSIAVTEVTFDEYDACVRAGGCASQPSDNDWGRGNRPVINVTWEEAQAYASWLSSKTGQSYALPTEAQWEYAARAGDSTPLIGGSAAALCAFANGASKESGLQWANAACTDPAADRTLPTAMLSANKFGVKDMIGNVAEWTQDCNTLNLRDAPTDGSADARGSCNQRVVRGGSWFSGPNDLRYAARLMQRRGDSNDFTGFRVIRKVGP
jgi:formylglycine-generating enzyme required for sulfatase activity